MKITEPSQIKDGMIIKHTFYASNTCNDCELKVKFSENLPSNFYLEMTNNSFCVTKDGESVGMLCHAMKFNDLNYMYNTVEDEVTGFLSIGKI